MLFVSSEGAHLCVWAESLGRCDHMRGVRGGYQARDAATGMGAPVTEAPICHRAVCMHRVKWQHSQKRWGRFCSRECVLKQSQVNGRWQAGMQKRHHGIYKRLIAEVLGHALRDEQVLTAMQVKRLIAGAYKRGWNTGYVRRQNEAAA
jgi:hypothetical protein